MGRFLSPDDVSYADPSQIDGLNLYAYCYNNPVMYSDPNGHDPEWWEWLLLGIAVAVVVVAGVVATVATGGAALVVAGIAIGGSVAGIASAVGQGLTNGWDNISVSGVATSMLVGSVLGGLGGAASAGIGAAGAGSLALAGGGTYSVGSAVVLGGLLAGIGANILLAQTSKSNGYYGERWPGDPHKPNHVHLRGNGIDIRIGRDGKPLPGESPLPSQARRALNKLWKEFIKLFERW